MATLDELSKIIEGLQAQVKQLSDENVTLRNQLGIRRYLQKKKPEPTDDDMEGPKSAANHNAESNPVQTSVKKPPPFFVNGIKSMPAFNSLIKESGITIGEMKATQSGELKIFTQSTDDYRKLRTVLDSIPTMNETDKKTLGAPRYHTFQIKDDKLYSVYIRNMHYSTDVNEIQTELESLGHEVVRITNVQIKKVINEKKILWKLPLFRIDLKPNVNNKEIFKLNTLLQYKIVVEYPRKTNTVAQCKRCQQIGHSQNYCNKSPRCVKCGGNHEFKNCNLSRSDQAKCANCAGPHTANYRGCPAFKSRGNTASRSTAVLRLRDEPAPKTHNQKHTYAKAVVNIAPTSEVEPDSGPSQCNETKQILDMLKGITAKQDELEKKLTDIAERVGNLEKVGNTPSPRRKMRKK